MQILKYGASGPQTELLQLALFRAGFLDEAGIDGIFGSDTRAALRRFQSSSGLNADGVAGPRSWQALTPWLVGYAMRTVRRGDTLSSLAGTFGSSVAAIDAANPGLDPLNLAVGSRLVIPLGFNVVPDNISFTSTVLELCVRGLRARYPFINAGSIGNSALGKTLYRLSIGSGRRELFVNASHHANEWITTPLLMKFLENYSAACAFGRRIGGYDAAALFSSAVLHLVPMVNPDGVDLVTGELASGSSAYRRAFSIAQGYPQISFPDGWKANINGVDLNLQYPADWERAREIKFAQGFTSPAPRDFVGSAPLSQPESSAVYNFTRKHDFKLTLSYHTQGNVIYWKYLDFEPADSRAIGRRFSELSGYPLELTPPVSSFAGYKDWFIEAYDRPGYTFEVGLGIAPLPLSQLGDIYAANEGVLAEAILIAGRL